MTMKFREFLDDKDSTKFELLSFTVEEFSVTVLVLKDSSEEVLLTEAQHRGKPLTGKYAAQYHTAHTPQGQEHIHVYAKNNQLFALNIDGSAHDASHQTQIPRRVADAIRAKFPAFNLPNDNFIESADHRASGIALKLILEADSRS